MAYLTNEAYHMASDVPLSEPRPGISKQVLPLSLEHLEVCWIAEGGMSFSHGGLGEILLETSTPFT
jgi:hypothetical protein